MSAWRLRDKLAPSTNSEARINRKPRTKEEEP
jgi:hypothetical protein